MNNSLDVASPSHPVEETEPDIRNCANNPAFASRATRSAFIGIPSVPLLLLALITSLPAVVASSVPTKTQLFRNRVDHRLFARQAATAAETCACVAESAHAQGAGFAVRAAMIPVIVILSGIIAGLTLGYLSLDTTQLAVLAKTGTNKQKRAAARVIPLLQNRHLLLVTLLLANMLLLEALPVVASDVFGGEIQAVVLSTVLVVIFSEIIPQSICSTYGLEIGSVMAVPTQGLIYFFWIIAYPISLILKRFVGERAGMIYRRGELKELINLHSAECGGDLHKDTVLICASALEFQVLTAKDAMTPLCDVFQLDLNTTYLDYETLGRIVKSGHSRIPVYETIGEGADEKKKIVSCLLTKQLILVDPEDGIPLRDIPMNPLPFVSEERGLLELLNTFQEGKSHMAIVCKSRPGFSTTVSHFTADLEEESSDSLLKSLFKRKKKVQDYEAGAAQREMEDKLEQQVREQAWLDARDSRNSLSNYYLDDEHPIGLICLEDLFEELLSEEIWDETDRVGLGSQPSLKFFVPQEAVGRVGFGAPPPSSSPSFGNVDLPPAVNAVNIVSRIKGLARSYSNPGKTRQGTPDIVTSEFEKGLEEKNKQEPFFSDITQSVSITSDRSTGSTADASTPLIAPTPVRPPSLAPAPLLFAASSSQTLPPGRRLVIATNVAPSSGLPPPSRGSTPPGPKGLFKSPLAVGNVPTRSTSNIVAGKDPGQSRSGATTTGSGGGSGATTPRAAGMESPVETSEGHFKGAD